MVQGADGDLVDIRLYEEDTPVHYVRDNEPLEDLNLNILTVDAKAILARDLSIVTQADLVAHIGSSGISTTYVELPHGTVSNGPFVVGELVDGDTSLATGTIKDVLASSLIVGDISGGPFQDSELLTGGTSGATATTSAAPVDVPEHADATSGSSGFMSSADYVKLSRVQNEAQLNVMSPLDAIELISRKSTTLHRHIAATTSVDGFLTAANKTKLDSVETGAEVNNISDANATTLTNGSNADALHSHGYAPGSETFTELVHAGTDHTGLPGIAGFPGFVASTYNLGSLQTGHGTTVFNQAYGFNPEIVTSGIAKFSDGGFFGGGETIEISNVQISGSSGIVTYTISGGYGADVQLQCWQGAYGIAP